MSTKEKNLGKERGRCAGQGSRNLQYKKNLTEKVKFRGGKQCGSRGIAFRVEGIEHEKALGQKPAEGPTSQ